MLTQASMRWPSGLAGPHPKLPKGLFYNAGHTAIMDLSKEKVPGRTFVESSKNPKRGCLTARLECHCCSPHRRR